MMNSVLALALAAQVVVANPVIRRQVTTSRAATTGTVTIPISSILTSAEFTETDTIPSATTYTVSEGPATTAVGGSDGSYWFCSFPGSSEPTATYSLPEPTDVPTDTITATFPEITETISSIIETDTEIVTDTDTDTETISASVFKRQVVTSTRTATAAATTLTSIAETDTFTDIPTESFPDPTIPLTTDFPTLTASPVPTGGGWVSTYTIVGPETTAVIECVRIPGRGGYHHGPPRPHYPPHHGTGPVTWSGPVPTTDVFTFSSVIGTDFPTATDVFTLSSIIGTDFPTATLSSVSATPTFEP